MDRNDFDRVPTAYAEGWWKEGLVKYLPRFFEFFFLEIFRDVDWQRPPHFLDTKLQAVAPRRTTNKRAGPRVVDALVDLQQLSGERAWVLVHIEIQAQKVDEFEKRMLLYHTRILERYGKPVCSLVILADKSNSWRPRIYRHELWGNELRFCFPVCKLLDLQEQLPELEQSTNPFALLTAATLHAQATRQNSRKRDAAKWRLVRGLYSLGLSKDEVLELFRLIDWVLRLSPRQEEDFWLRLQEMERELRMPYITSVERIGMEKGLERGREQGRTEGEAALRKMVQEILESRFQVVSKDVQDRLDSYSGLEGLRALGRLALTAESLDEFRERME